MVGRTCHWPVLTAAVVAFGAAALTAGCSTSKAVTPRVIVEAIDGEVGTSNAAPGTSVGWMPYELPLTANEQPVLVGNTQVYMNAAPGTTFVVRPTASGIQTFVYLSGPSAS